MYSNTPGVFELKRDFEWDREVPKCSKRNRLRSEVGHVRMHRPFFALPFRGTLRGRNYTEE